MHIFAAIICSAFLGAPAVLGQSKEPDVKMKATVGQNITINMTRKDEFKDIEVSVLLGKIEDLDKEQRVWQVKVELEELKTTNPTTTDPKTTDPTSIDNGSKDNDRSKDNRTNDNGSIPNNNQSNDY